MGGYFTGTGKLDPDNRRREDPSVRDILNTEGYLRRQFAGKFAGTFNARGLKYY